MYLQNTELSQKTFVLMCTGSFRTEDTWQKILLRLCQRSIVTIMRILTSMKRSTFRMVRRFRRRSMTIKMIVLRQLHLRGTAILVVMSLFPPHWLWSKLMTLNMRSENLGTK